MSSTLQSTRFLQMSAPNRQGQWLVTELTCLETVNESFQIELACVTDQCHLTPDDLIAKPVALTVGKSGNQRVFHGLIRSFELDAEITRQYQNVTLFLEPWFTFLNVTLNCRVFQDKSVVDIFRLICKEYQFSHYSLSGLTRTYEPIEYCTQYNESDYTFLQRMLQHAGISFVFEHEADKHVLCLFDNIHIRPQSPKALRFTRDQKATSVVYDWVQHYRWHSNQSTALDYDPANPDKATAVHQSHAQPSTIEGRDTFKQTHFANPNFQPPAELSYLDHMVEAKSNDMTLNPGSLFTMGDFPSDQSQQGVYFNLAITHYATDDTGLPFAHSRSTDKTHVFSYENHISCFRQKYAYAPLKTVPWPLVGQHTATVVGVDLGKPHVDRFARIKIQFHWDRLGDYTGNSSRWVRVAQPHGGKHHGFQFIPRVGAEVVVDFICGNPDRPQIMGVLPNADNPLPFSPTQRPNVSGFKSRSIGSTHTEQGNEVSFDDTKANPRVTIAAENALKISAKGDETLSVGKNLTHTVTGDHHITSRDHITYHAKDQITINAGDSSITLTPSRIAIQTQNFDTGMPASPQTLAEKVPVYTPTSPGQDSPVKASLQKAITGKHWVQGVYLDSAGKGLSGMMYHIEHSNGQVVTGVLDAEGKTQKVTGLKAGVATIVYGNQAQLTSSLNDARAQLQVELNSILAKTKAYAAAHPDKIIHENWLEREFNRNVAMLEGLRSGAIKSVKSIGEGIVHLFSDMAESQALQDRGMADALSGNTKDSIQVEQASIAEGKAMYGPLAKGVTLMHLIFEDAKTRKMLEQFAVDYYRSETPIMVDKQIGAAVGGLALGLIVAVIMDNPTAVVSGLASKVGIELSTIARLANKIADLLKDLKQCKRLDNAALDKTHVAIIRPEGVDEGAIYHAEVESRPNPGYETEVDLQHPAGTQYKLKKQEAKNFSGKPEAFEAKVGESYIRIMDKANPYSKANGAWWMKLNQVPKTKAQWRSLFAVLEKWNKDGSYVLWKADKPLPGWKGLAATQKLKDEAGKTIPNWILAGGGEQLYFPTSQLDIPENLIRHSTQDWEWLND